MKKKDFHMTWKMGKLAGEREYFCNLKENQKLDKGSISDALQYFEIDVGLKLLNNISIN